MGGNGLKDLYPDSREWFMEPWIQRGLHNFVDTHGANEQCHSLNLEFFTLNREQPSRPRIPMIQ